MTKDKALKMAHKTFMQLNERSPRKEDGSGYFDKEINACKEALEQPAQTYIVNNTAGTQFRLYEQPVQEPVADDELHLAKHAKEYHGLTLNQFKLMCNEADKRYEGQFANSVDKHLAVESFYEGFKVAIKEALEQPKPPAKTTSLEDVIKEFEKDQEMKALLDLARKQVKGMELEQPAQEPNCYGDGNVYRGLRSEDSKVKTYHVNTHPHQWQGLTEDEIDAAADETDKVFATSIFWVKEFARAIEQALKEKNT